jgi:hypothetical protein
MLARLLEILGVTVETLTVDQAASAMLEREVVVRLQPVVVEVNR